MIPLWPSKCKQKSSVLLGKNSSTESQPSFSQFTLLLPAKSKDAMPRDSAAILWPQEKSACWEWWRQRGESRVLTESGSCYWLWAATSHWSRFLLSDTQQAGMLRFRGLPQKDGLFTRQPSEGTGGSLRSTFPRLGAQGFYGMRNKAAELLEAWRPWGKVIEERCSNHGSNRRN